MTDEYNLDNFQRLKAKLILMDADVSYSYKDYVQGILDKDSISK